MINDPRPMLKSVLARENLADPAVHWQALSGGRTNRVWQVGEGAGALICKLYQPASDNPVYPNMPGAEYDTLRALHAYDIAPRPLALLHTKAGDVLVYRCLTGCSWQEDTTAVAALLGRLHQIPARFPLRRLPSGSAALLDQSQRILTGLRTRISIPNWLAGRAEVPPSLDLSILHTDVVPGNVIVSDGTLRLIDWQSPALGDPAEDIASFLSPAMQLLYRARVLEDDERRAFLNVYPNQQVIARYLALAPCFHLRIAAYCAWKTTRGEGDYESALKVEWAALQRLAKT